MLTRVRANPLLLYPVWLRLCLDAAAQEGKFQAAKVKFKPEVTNRVRNEWHCRLVEEESEPDGVVVTLLAYSLDWLADWVFSFGSKAQVICPEELRQMVGAEAERVVAKYVLVPPLESAPYAMKSLLT